MTQRDTFFNVLYEQASKNKDIYLVSADMGAPSLDRFRKDLPNQYIDVGIAEQNAILIATGLALEGKKVFVYAIAPFVTLRPYEMIRLEMACMNLPITLVGVGSGMSYDDSGPTHHMVEDISCLRILPNFEIFNITDNVMAGKIAEELCGKKQDTYGAEYNTTEQTFKGSWFGGPNLVRLDRKDNPNYYNGNHDFNTGISHTSLGLKTYLIATGNMVHTALEVTKELNKKLKEEIGVIDIYRFPIAERNLQKITENATLLFTLEEHTMPGGMGSAVCEALSETGIKIKRLGCDFSKGYCYQYGGREVLQAEYGLDKETVKEEILKWL